MSTFFTCLDILHVFFYILTSFLDFFWTFSSRLNRPLRKGYNFGGKVKSIRVKRSFYPPAHNKQKNTSDNSHATAIWQEVAQIQISCCSSLIHQNNVLADNFDDSYMVVRTCLNPGTSLITVPSVFTHFILGNGVPRLWQMTSAPVVLEKSTWFGGSWTNTGPETSDWAATEKEQAVDYKLRQVYWIKLSKVEFVCICVELVRLCFELVRLCWVEFCWVGVMWVLLGCEKSTRHSQVDIVKSRSESIRFDQSRSIGVDRSWSELIGVDQIHRSQS